MYGGWYDDFGGLSLPSRERGLKFRSRRRFRRRRSVAPFAGAWIEISLDFFGCAGAGSLPSRERGLKLVYTPRKQRTVPVAPFAGAWIEIDGERQEKAVGMVAPFAGAWIEIKKR